MRVQNMTSLGWLVATKWQTRKLKKGVCGDHFGVAAISFYVKNWGKIVQFPFFSLKQKVVLQCCLAPLKGEKPLVSNNVTVCRELYKWGPCGRECLSQVHWWFTRMTSWLSLSPVFVCFSCQIQVQTERHNKLAQHVSTKCDQDYFQCVT